MGSNLSTKKQLFILGNEKAGKTHLLKKLKEVFEDNDEFSENKSIR